MHSFSKLLGALLLAVAMSAHAADPATVNGKPVKQYLIDYMIKVRTAAGQKVDDDVRAELLNSLIGQEAVLQEAQKAGTDKNPDFLAQQELRERELLVNTFLQDYIKKNPVDDAVVKAEYDKIKAQGIKEYKASHILVKTEQEAKDIIAQLAKNGDFAKIAKEKSLDPSKDKGGDLGWFTSARMVRPFADAVSKLQKGLYTTIPVQTQFGWHVIKLEDSRDAQIPPFDTVKEEIRGNFQKQKILTLVSDLRAKAKIVDNSPTKNKK